MNRSASILSFALIALIFFSFIPQASAKRPVSINLLADELKTPEAVREFLKKNIRYVTDTRQFGVDEYWQSPEETLSRGAGDCEDFALLAKAILERNGYQVFLLSLYWENNAHTVAVFEANGTWGIFDLDRLSYAKAVSMADLSNAVRNDWDYIGLMRQEGNIGIISRKFKEKDAYKASILPLLAHPSAPGN